ncbi:MAG: hypothetical protein KGL74_13745 [Elusimicrobia bacterium]|nr:hypothetical protein [Elusimicrobiota bacterium]MDE2512183.1 hypothetical protein [Elusimicrobiota bacterium]
MIRRAIAAAFVLGLTASAASAFNSPTYNEAKDLAAGKSAASAYDGNTARGAVRAEVNGALNPGELTVPAAPALKASSSDVLRAADVPAPDKAAEKEGFFSGRSLLMGSGGAALGGTVGWLFGGLLGAAIGAAAGFAIGFLVSKLLH